MTDRTLEENRVREAKKLAILEANRDSNTGESNL